MNLISDLLKLPQVRSILTVSPVDLPDELLAEYGLEDDIAADLDRRLPQWAGLTDVNQVRSLRLYVKYRAAAIIAVTAPIFVMKKSTDGSNEGQRSDADGFLWLADTLNGKADAVLNELLEELGIDVSVEPFNLVGKSEPTRDPITEPREDVS